VTTTDNPESAENPSRVRLTILGSGPAGLTAAIYAARANLEPLVLEGEPSSTSDQPGGQLMLTTEVENFPGFPEGIMGPELMAQFRSQAERFGTKFQMTKAAKVDLSSRPMKIWTSQHPDLASDTPADIATDALIIATGARSLTLGLPKENLLIGHGVSTCATCDGFFFRDQDIAVVGGGDSAMEEAVFLTRFAKSVTIVHRRDRLRASPIMQERAKANPKIVFKMNSVVTELIGEDHLEGVLVEDVTNGTRSKLDITGLFIAIGHAPATTAFIGQLEMDSNGYINTFEGTRTSVPGVFACGDVQDRVYKQAITAAGSGCMAALDAQHWLEEQGSSHL